MISTSMNNVCAFAVCLWVGDCEDVCVCVCL